MQANFLYIAFGRALQRTCPSSCSTKSLLSTFSNATTPHHRPENSLRRPSSSPNSRPCSKSKRTRGIATQCESQFVPTTTASDEDLLEGAKGGERAQSQSTRLRVARVYNNEDLQRPWLPSVDRKVNYRRNRPDLLKTLRTLGFGSDIPNPSPGRSNLSYTDHKLPTRKTPRWMERVLTHRTNVGLGVEEPAVQQEASDEEVFPPPEPFTELRHADIAPVSISLPHITSSFIRASVAASRRHPQETILFNFHETDIDLLDRVFTPEAMAFLEKRGYTPEDVVIWSWILLAKNGIEAGLRIKFYLQTRSALHKGPLSLHEPLPAFLYLFTLRRKPLTRQSLLILLPLMRSLILQEGPNTHVLELKSQMVLLLRLIRRCGEEFPSLLPKVGDLAARMINERAGKEVTEAITFSCNKLLALFGRQTLTYPYSNLPYRWQPQLSMVKAMIKNEIQINREGYRALVAVQLGREKGSAERLWIKGMKESWPPFRDQRDQLALSDQNALKEAMASIMLEKMTQAGYQHTEWEHSSNVLAGTDFDGKPTIPTRTSSSLPMATLIERTNRAKVTRWGKSFQQREAPVINSETGDAGLDADVTPGQGLHKSYYWTAKVRATRTLEEAYAQFLACRKVMTPTQRVYFQMFEKLVHAQKHSRDQEIAPKQPPEPRKFRFFSPEPEPIVLDPSQPYQPWEGDEAVAGESRKVFPNPRDPSLRVHVAERIPDIPHLVKKMLEDGLEPSAPLIALLINHAQGLGMVSWILRIGNVIEGSIFTDSIKFKSKKLDKRILAALLNALIRSHDDENIRKAIRLLFDQNPQILPPWKAVLSGLASIFFRVRHSRLQITSREILSLTGDVLRHIPEVVDFEPDVLSTLATTVRRFIVTETTNHHGQSDSIYKFDEAEYWQGLPPDERVIQVFEKLVGVKVVERVRQDVTRQITAAQKEMDSFWIDLEDDNAIEPDEDDEEENDTPKSFPDAVLPPDTYVYSPPQTDTPTPTTPALEENGEHRDLLVIPSVAVFSDYIRMLRRTGQFREILVAVIIYRVGLEAKIKPSFGIGEFRRKRNLLAELTAFVESEENAVANGANQSREVVIRLLKQEAENLRKLYLEQTGSA
ncbi:hypothetical protein BJ508DRAFT_417051 [Ascobolus immersus RN42]|uniref:Uncharacterized protein n=1 Tax=Ascobolus immersus RN42 TaxID=1160509 RepID=A0A3N4HUT8_ASCIM|nr:hypothetical protein BJ508DRAFT_417051 [Ascobolus immersus RN42]